MEEKPEVLCMHGAALGRRKGMPDLVLELLEKILHDLLLRRIVIVKVAVTDADIGGDRRGRNTWLAIAVEKKERRIRDTFGSLPLRLVI